MEKPSAFLHETVLCGFFWCRSRGLDYNAPMTLKELAILQTIADILPDKAQLSDDAYYEPETRLIYTTDLLVENHHFSLDYFSGADLGWKAAAVNISDVAALGGEPRFLLVSLGLPESVSLAWVHDFYQGMQALLNRTGGKVIGGDTVGSDSVVVNVTAIGTLPTGHTAGRRFQARPGDWVITTGYSGLSAVGLHVLQQNIPGFDSARNAHLRPEPRLAEGAWLSGRYERYALTDSSDGLADAVLKIAQASQVTIEIQADLLSRHPEVLAFSKQSGQDPESFILYGGEDFELLATVPDLPDPLPEGVSVIGRVVEGTGTAVLISENGQTRTELSLDKTYQHFTEEWDA